MEYVINTEWDSKPIKHHPTKIVFTYKVNNNFVAAEVYAKFFNDPSAPNGHPGDPFPRLYDYEGMLLVSNLVYLIYIYQNTKHR